MSTLRPRRLIRFLSSPNSHAHVGEPVDGEVDVGLALYEGKSIEAYELGGNSLLHSEALTRTGKVLNVHQLLSPIAQDEIGTIRCIGLNYMTHAQEVNLPIPDVPVLFMKPDTALGNPFPGDIVIPAAFAADNAADFESEVAIVIKKAAKDVPEEKALEYLLGITAANDVSSRVAQFAQSQWCFSKSFDYSCPLGPALVPAEAIQNLADVTITGALNGQVVQQSGLDDLIFSIPKIISFLSQGTTLKPGTVILTGTPAGVGWSREPRKLLQHGDEFRIHVSHGVGTLINRIQVEKH